MHLHKTEEVGMGIAQLSMGRRGWGWEITNCSEKLERNDRWGTLSIPSTVVKVQPTPMGSVPYQLCLCWHQHFYISSKRSPSGILSDPLQALLPSVSSNKFPNSPLAVSRYSRCGFFWISGFIYMRVLIYVAENSKESNPSTEFNRSLARSRLK
jgi:hypothetical protein